MNINITEIHLTKFGKTLASTSIEKAINAIDICP